MLAEGLILTSHGNGGVVELPGSNGLETNGSRDVHSADDTLQLPCRYRRSVGRPICGDRVRVCRTGSEECAVEEILPRTNAFARGDGKSRKQFVAANLDQVLIVVAPNPQPSRDLIDRYLVAAHSLDIPPLLVLNKAEMLAAGEQPAALSRLDEYPGLRAPLLTTSCKGPPGVAALARELSGRISILAGQSGVGKSSLINALIPNLDVQTGALSRATGKGTHTTTATTMYRLPDGGRLIDSPGVWEYGLWAMSQTELEHGFPDFAPWAGQCRFNDCVHDTEPECAVRAAVAAGQILAWRHDAYLRLLRQAT